MNTDVVMAWVDALESGEYQQSKYALRTSRGYCCLGVLLDVAIRRGDINAEWVEESPNNPYLFVLHNPTEQGGDRIYETHSYLVDTVAQMVGLKAGGGMLPGRYSDSHKMWQCPDGSTADTLTAVNDGDHGTFRQIAQMIRHQVLQGQVATEESPG